MAAGVYEIFNAATGKRYIGSSVRMAERFGRHRKALESGSHHSGKLQNAWGKYGAAAFAFRPILVCSVENLLMYEQIAFDAFAPEYNICKIAGATRGVKLSAKHKAKVSAALKGRPHGPMSPETKAKLSAARRGKYLGPRPDSVGRKISEALKGRPLSDEHRAKLSAIHVGRKQPREVIERQAASRRGKKRGQYKKHTAEANARRSLMLQGNQYNKGKKASPEARQNMRAAQQKRRASEAEKERANGR